LERIEAALQRSAWQLSVRNPAGALVGFVRVTSDLALNANLWDLTAHPADPQQEQLMIVLVYTTLHRLKRELSGCSISVAATPMAQEALKRHGFVVDPSDRDAIRRRRTKKPRRSRALTRVCRFLSHEHGVTRTPDTQNRNLMLYPTELHALTGAAPHGPYLSRQSAPDPFGCIAWSCASSAISRR
ncbi:MAG: hypothetical protein RLZZ11_1729, partial [Cyanobacteriota bacterium]